jgi:hypothetical protein
LSLAIDLGLGLPMEHALRSCLIALRLAEHAGLDEAERAVVYYVGLLAWVGCHADAYEQAAWFGDDIALKADMFSAELVGARGLGLMVRHLGAGSPPLSRARIAAAFVAHGRKLAEPPGGTHCLVAGRLAVRLGLDQNVYDSLQHVFERWDGKGRPAGLRGEELSLPARIVQLASIGSRSVKRAALRRRPRSCSTDAARSSIPRSLSCSAVRRQRSSAA